MSDPSDKLTQITLLWTNAQPSVMAFIRSITPQLADAEDILQETDFVSPGPWVDGVEARVGVDKDGDGTVDDWTDRQKISESYIQKPGFARIVDVDPAAVDLSGLPKGKGFAFEFHTQGLESGGQPTLDRVTLEFD